jgi:cytochrome c biogenesis protein CcdA/glutaredoxin
MINFKLVKTLLVSVFLLAVSVFFVLRPPAVFAADAASGASAGERIEIIFFHSETCPHCKAEKVFLDKLAEKYSDLTIAGYEISTKDNQRLYEDYVKRYNVAYGVPLTVIGDKPILGFFSEQTTGKEIEDMVDALRKGEDGPDKGLRTGFSILGWNFTVNPETSLPLLAVIFGLADGINPCMFSVLMMLLAYLLTSGSARRAVISGILFGVSVFLIYFLMMAGIYESLSFFGGNLTQLMTPLKMFFGWVFVIVGIWMAKDFIFLKKGQKVSFAIPRMAHPLIKKLVRQSSYMAVILLALFSSLVELPCTFALPLGYAAILAARGAAVYPYIFLYNLFFVLPLFLIVGAVSLGFSRVSRLEEWRERSKKTMRLVSGLLLFLLGMAFLFKIF